MLLSGTFGNVCPPARIFGRNELLPLPITITAFSCQRSLDTRSISPYVIEQKYA